MRGGGGDGHELKPGHVGKVKILFYPLLGVTKSNLRISWGIGVLGCIFFKCHWLLEDCRPLVTLFYTCVISKVTTSYFIYFIGCDFLPSTISSFEP